MLTPEESYKKNKTALLKIVRKNGSTYFRNNRGNQAVGLSNQGATCYLNSLLQTLFFTNAFREAILKSKSTSLIIKEFQYLFGSLSLSKMAAIDTKSLTHAFGWSNISVFEQADVHELFSVLIDALGQVDDGLKIFFANNFQGSCKDVLECPKCNYCKEDTGTFLNVSLDIPTECDNNSATIQELLANYQQQEVLDVDNSWECSSCLHKVQATKCQTFEKLPSCLFIHLKRFRYDKDCRRKVKVNTAVHFDSILESSSFYQSNLQSATGGEFHQYTLNAVLLHTGTAIGGHYRVYIVNSGKYVDFNDASVNCLDEDELRSLFWYAFADRGSIPTDNAISDDGKPLKRMIIYENVYMLAYQRKGVDEACKLTGNIINNSSTQIIDVDNTAIPDEIVKRVEIENSDYEELTLAYEYYRLLHNITVYFIDTKSSSSKASVTVEVINTISLGELKLLVMHEFSNNGIIVFTESDTTNFRLRQYNAISSNPGETFTFKENNFLSSFHFEHSFSLALEMKVDADEVFVEFNPKDILLRVKLWNPSFIKFTSNAEKDDIQYEPLSDYESSCSECKLSVAVVGEDLSTGEDLYRSVADAVEKHLKLELIAQLKNSESDEFLNEFPLLTSRLYITSLNSSTHNSFRKSEIIFIDADAKLLKKDYHIFSGDSVLVELLPIGESRLNYSSNAIATFQSMTKKIKIFFNNPFLLNNDGNQNEGISFETTSSDLDLTIDNISSKDENYPYHIDITPESSLIQAKNEMLKVLLKVDEVTSSDDFKSYEFFIKRNSFIGAPQLKDEDKTLNELAIFDQSVLHLQSGVGCKSGEFMLHFCVDLNGPYSIQARLLSIGEIAINERAKVSQVKEILFDSWKSLVEKKMISLKKSKEEFTAPKDQIMEAGVDNNVKRTSANIDFEEQITRLTSLSPSSHKHIRIRDGKNVSNAVSPILRDDRVFGRCLLGLADGRKIIVQILEKPEIITNDDITISARLASYEKKTLTNPLDSDLILPRSCSFGIFHDMLLLKFGIKSADDVVSPEPIKFVLPDVAAISVAKTLTTGPPLTLKAALKLKWFDINSANVLSANSYGEGEKIAFKKPLLVHTDESSDPNDTQINDANTKRHHVTEGRIDGPMFNLRDGAGIIVREIQDFERAKQKIAANQLEKESADIDSTESVTGTSLINRRLMSQTINSRPKSSSYLRRAKAGKPSADSNLLSRIRSEPNENALKIIL